MRRRPLHEMELKWSKEDKVEACLAYLSGALARAAYANGATIPATLLAPVALILASNSRFETLAAYPSVQWGGCARERDRE